MNNKKLIIITGPSGVGKTSVVKGVLEAFPSLARLKTYTTREKRDRETSADYHFVAEKKFKDMIKKKQLLEWARVYGHYYGSSKAELQKLWKKYDKVLMLIDVQGAKTLKKESKSAKIIFIKPDSGRNLLNRLSKRGRISVGDYEQRTAMIKKELAYAGKCDFVVANKEGALRQAIQEIAVIIQKI